MTISEWVCARCDRTFRSRNWAGKGALAALARVTAEVAHWRPHPKQHTIAETVLHMAFWKDVVAGVLASPSYRYRGEDNWRTVEPTDAGWRQAQGALRTAHRGLMRVLRRLRDRDLLKKVRGGRKVTVADLAVDIATHDSYHAAQIFVLRRLDAHARAGVVETTRS
jgi:uncharacterized damage-inducible protein DinB